MRTPAGTGWNAEATRLADSSRGPWTNDRDVDSLSEEIIRSFGLVDEAYARHGLPANRGGIYLATFRAAVKKYPHKAAAETLAPVRPEDLGPSRR